MATAEENNRKRFTGSEEQLSARAPPKKRFIPSRSTSPSLLGDGGHVVMDESGSEDTADTFKEPLEAYRRDAIQRQWKEYKRTVLRWKRRAVMSEKKHDDNEKQLYLWETQFQQLQSYLQGHFATHLLYSHSHDTPTVMDLFNQQEWTKDMDSTLITAFKREISIDSLVTHFHRYTLPLSTMRTQCLEMADALGDTSFLKEQKNNYRNTLYSFTHHQHSLETMLRQHCLSNIKLVLFEEELRLVTLRFTMADTLLRDMRHKISKIDSQRSHPTSSGHSGPQDSFEQESAENSDRLPSCETTAPMTPKPHHDPLISAQQTLERQLQEIEHMKDQRIEMKQHLVQLQVDLVVAPEAYIYKTPLCRQLLQSCDYQRDKSDHLMNLFQKLQKDLEESQSHRRQVLDDLDGKQNGHIKGLEEQLRKLESDLTRIRGQRDALQSGLEERKANAELGRDSILEWKMMSDVKKEHVNCLKIELSRLRLKRAAKTGSQEKYRCILTAEDSRRITTHMRQELREVKEKINLIKSRYSVTADALALVNNNLLWAVETHSAHKKANAFETTYGFHVATTDQHSVLTTLQAKVKSEHHAIEEAQQKVESLESTEQQLLSEISNVTMALTELEEQNMTRIQKLTTLEDEMLVLQGERVKYSQTFTALNKSKDAHAMVANALSKQVEKQLAYIKQLNEREKNLASQITALERQAAASTVAVEMYQQKSAEVGASLDELKEKMSLTRDKMLELEKSITEKVRSIEEGAHTRMRLEEGSELLRRKIEATTKVEKPMEMKLRREKEEYRSLLNCSSCRTQLKSHVLMRCMHTFCKECLDIRIETRQRRCPSCGESFGVNDVKQFYL
ncbi:hypothetical protein BDF14DRAFT_1832327 [Spinellus fusiger]|nr:hypothetical protein BDF14DRAFT_1832327 [Spinellus fusiger]